MSHSQRRKRNPGKYAPSRFQGPLPRLPYPVQFDTDLEAFAALYVGSTSTGSQLSFEDLNGKTITMNVTENELVEVPMKRILQEGTTASGLVVIP